MFLVFLLINKREVVNNEGGYFSMYRANNNNYYQNEEIDKNKELGLVNRGEKSIKRTLFQITAITGGLLMVSFLFFAVGNNLDPMSLVPLPNLRAREEVKELEVFLQEEKKEISRVENGYFKPSKAVVILGESFGVGVWLKNGKEGNSFITEIKYDPRELTFDSFVFSKGVKGTVNEKGGVILLEGEIDSSLGEEMELGRAIFETIFSGDTKIETNGQFFELRVVEKAILESGVASCSATMIKKPYNLRAKSGPGLGEIKLSWDGGEDEKIGLKYGKISGNYEFGWENVGKESSFIVSNLEPGKKYFLVVFSRDECGKSSIFSNEVGIEAGFGAMTQESIEEFEGLLPVAERLIP